LTGKAHVVLVIHRLIAIGYFKMGVIVVSSNQKWFWKFWVAKVFSVSVSVKELPRSNVLVHALKLSLFFLFNPWKQRFQFAYLRSWLQLSPTGSFQQWLISKIA
jgi:hypothetical protein